MASTRRPVHLRRIECAGFVREDGLFEIEGTLTDTKPTALALPEKTVAAGSPIHRMRLCLVVDRGFVIRELRAEMPETPYRVCAAIAPSYGQLVGHRIEAGFTMKVKRMFRDVAGCSHLSELLPAMATAVFQVVWADPDNFEHEPSRQGAGRGSPLGGCHALRRDGEVALRYFANAGAPPAEPSDGALRPASRP